MAVGHRSLVIPPCRFRRRARRFLSSALDGHVQAAGALLAQPTLVLPLDFALAGADLIVLPLLLGVQLRADLIVHAVEDAEHFAAPLLHFTRRSDDDFLDAIVLLRREVQLLGQPFQLLPRKLLRRARVHGRMNQARDHQSAGNRTGNENAKTGAADDKNAH